MNLRAKKVVVGLIILSVTGEAVAWGCPPVIDSVWQSAMTAANTTISTAIKLMVETVSTARATNLMRIQSALRVTAKQIDVSSEKQAATEVAAKQAGANYAVELSNRKAVLETAMEYNAATGQGFDPCGEQQRSQNVAVALGEANTNVPDRVMSELDSAPGRMVPNQGEVVAKRLSDGRTLYCTADQVKAGICSQPGNQAGMDVDAGHFFTTYQVGTPEARAKSALLNNVYGVPYAAPDQSMANSPAAKAFFEAKRTEDGYRSVSQTSMKTLQSWTESRPGGNSVIGSIATKVGTYAGGENYLEWEKKKASESEHGLLVELAKMRAFELYMRNLEYQQLERQEANIASVLALRARNMRAADGGQSSEWAAQRSKVE